MSRRKSTHGVSLFPFLDVLVSAMGSLILLLMIATYHTPRTPNDTNPLEMLQATVAPVETEDSQRALQLAQERAERQREIDAALEAQRLALEEHENQNKATHAKWQSNLAAMEERNQELMRQAIQARHLVETQTEESTQSSQQVQKLADMIAAAENRNAANLQNETDLQQQALDLFEKRKELQSEIEAKKVAQAIRKPVFEVIAHDGNSGTDRRPILIECRSDGLTFASEKVHVSARDLNEFAPEQNPLLAGAEALMTYWTLVDAQKGDKKSQPYVLLIVRPSGTVGFYVARKYLEGLNQEYGYELVPEGAEIRWPASDPNAVEVCRTAVERARHEARVYAAGGPSGPGKGNGFTGRRIPGGAGGSLANSGISPSRGTSSEQIVGSNGEFQLPEVEELKNSSPRDSIDMLGPEWSRQKRNAGGGSSSSGPTPGGEMGSEARATGQGVSSQSSATNAAPAAQGQTATAANGSARGATQSGIGSRASSTQAHPLGTGSESEQREKGSFSTMAGSESSSRRSEFDRPPDMPNSPLAEKSNNMPRDGGTDRQWGRPGRSGAIGIEREIIMQLYADRISIVEGPNVTIPPEISRSEFHELVSAMIQTQAMNWGDPPQKFIWRPRVKIEIHPGGNQHYGRLKELLTHWGISSKIEHKLD